MCCSTCRAPILCESEIITTTAPTLQGAVYMYPLEILEQEVPVYSATNPTSSRFDVVRVALDPANSPPSPPPPIGVSNSNAELTRAILNRLRVDPAEHGPSLTTEQLLEDLDALVDDESHDLYPGEEQTLIASRLTAVGKPVAEYSWFPGYSWSVMYCSKCMTHIGWAFSPTEENSRHVAFVGIIVTRLREVINR